MPILFLLILIVLAVVVGFRRANHDYTIGSGLFRSSKENIDKKRCDDASDYNYYNDTDKLN